MVSVIKKSTLHYRTANLVNFTYYLTKQQRVLLLTDTLIFPVDFFLFNKIQYVKTIITIAAYMCISVDEEKGSENTSIENQKKIISDHINANFSDSIVDFYEDRDRSGYTFEHSDHK